MRETIYRKLWKKVISQEECNFMNRLLLEKISISTVAGVSAIHSQNYINKKYNKN